MSFKNVFGCHQHQNQHQHQSVCLCMKKSDIERVRTRLTLTVARLYCLVKMGQPRPLFHLFSSLQTHITILTTNKCEKYPSSIWCWDSNSRPSDDESTHITTRAGLSPKRGLSYSLSVIHDLKCDQIWRNFATLVTFED